MGLRSLNNPASEFDDVFANTGTDAVAGPPKAGMVASGGNVTRTYTDCGVKYRAHIFTASGSLVVTDVGGYGAGIEYLVVAGGGGGGGTGGGGGGAGLPAGVGGEGGGPGGDDGENGTMTTGGEGGEGHGDAEAQGKDGGDGGGNGASGNAAPSSSGSAGGTGGNQYVFF